MESTWNESGLLGTKAEGILLTIYLQQQLHKDQHLPVLSVASDMKL
jgi:hypothetical protein